MVGRWVRQDTVGVGDGELIGRCQALQRVMGRQLYCLYAGGGQFLLPSAHGSEGRLRIVGHRGPAEVEQAGDIVRCRSDRPGLQRRAGPRAAPGRAST